MAEINPPLYLDQDDAYGADELGLPYRDIMGEGIVRSTDLAVSAGTGLKSSVAAGAAWIAGDDDANAQPTYRVRNDAAILLQHDAADATNPRIDVVIAEVLDSTFSGVSKLWRLRIVKGTPAGSPTAPATPGNAIALAQVTIPAGSGTLGTITDVRARAIVGGGKAKAPDSGAKVATSISALNTAYAGAPQDGALGLLRIGSSPYTEIPVTYDATKGKWVSVTQAFESGSISTNTVSASTDQIVSVWVVNDWADIAAAGLSMEVRAGAWLQANGTSFAGYTFGIKSQLKSGAPDTSKAGYTSLASISTMPDTSEHFFDTGWQAANPASNEVAVLSYFVSPTTTGRTITWRPPKMRVRFVG